MNKSNPSPFFSIVIPTYNRSADLGFAMDNILQQKFTDFEVIVSDNKSTDATCRVVTELKDFRIKYYCNKYNLGWIQNVAVGIKKARGRYIILHGDDDYFADNKSLGQVYSICKKDNPGYIRLNYLSKIEGGNTLFDFNISKNFLSDKQLSANSPPEDIMDFIEGSDPYFLTGICFYNLRGGNASIIDSEFIPWFKIIFEQSLKYGAYFFSGYVFISKWVKKKKNPGHPYFYLKGGKFTFEQYFWEVKKRVNGKYFRKFFRKHMGTVISNLPANKLSTGNLNVIKCARRIIELSPKHMFSTGFIFYLSTALILPFWILNILKIIKLRRVVSRNIK